MVKILKLKTVQFCLSKDSIQCVTSNGPHHFCTFSESYLIFLILKAVRKFD